MGGYLLKSEHYLLPTPAGAYYAVASARRDPARRLLFTLLGRQHSHRAEVETLARWSGSADVQEALELLYRMQDLGWIQGETAVREAPAGVLEEILPGLLALLSGDGKALLADQQGFHLAGTGFSHETAEELSALSADLASLHQRHEGLLTNNLGIATAAWAMVDAAGNSQLGCWPLHIGAHCFSLVLSGLPQFNQPAFTDMVWLLSNRYAASET